MSEDKLQSQIFTRVWNEYPGLRGLLFHVPNGGTRNKIEAAKMKGMGVVSGVADLLFIYNGSLHAFELKVGNNTQSEAQKNWAERVWFHGVKYYVVRTEEEFFSIFAEITKL